MSDANSIIDRLRGWLHNDDISTGDTALLMGEAVAEIEAGKKRVVELVEALRQCELYAEMGAVPLDRLQRSFTAEEAKAYRAFIDEYFDTGVVEPPPVPRPHGVIYDRPGWVCSMCGGWNHLQYKHCTHTHPVTQVKQP